MKSISSYHDYRLKARGRVSARFSRFLLRSYLSIFAVFAAIPVPQLSAEVSRPTLFAPFVPFCGYSRLIFARWGACPERNTSAERVQTDSFLNGTGTIL
jgi:hypothetical protein